MDRAPDYESGGWRFESFRARHSSKENVIPRQPRHRAGLRCSWPPHVGPTAARLACRTDRVPPLASTARSTAPRRHGRAFDRCHTNHNAAICRTERRFGRIFKQRPLLARGRNTSPAAIMLEAMACTEGRSRSLSPPRMPSTWIAFSASGIICPSAWAPDPGVRPS